MQFPKGRNGWYRIRPVKMNGEIYMLVAKVQIDAVHFNVDRTYETEAHLNSQEKWNGPYSIPIPSSIWEDFEMKAITFTLL